MLQQMAAPPEITGNLDQMIYGLNTGMMGCYFLATEKHLEMRAPLVFQALMAAMLLDGRFDCTLSSDEQGLITISGKGKMYDANGLWDEETAKAVELKAVLKEGATADSLLLKASFYAKEGSIAMNSEGDWWELVG